jgi:hypothetical protein
MKYFRRRAFSGSASLSLFLIVAATLFSVRSRSTADEIGWGSSNERYYFSVDCWRGEIGIHRFFTPDEPLHRSRHYFHVEEWGAGNTLDNTERTWVILNGLPNMRIFGTRFLGFGIYWFCFEANYAINLFIPLWAVIFGAIPIPAYWAIRRLRTNFRTGYCAQCGYDLRATRERCPECGTIPPKK